MTICRSAKKEGGENARRLAKRGRIVYDWRDYFTGGAKVNVTIFFWALWLAVSVFIFGIFFWTTQALMQQKQVWREFARKNKLSYVPGPFLSSPVVKGALDGNEFTLTSEARDTGDLRGRRFLTTIQFSLPSHLPTGGVVGSGEFRAFVRALDARDDLPLVLEGVADGAVMARSDDAAALAGYFTPARLKVLETLVKQNGVNVLYLFDHRYCLVRLETLDPLIKPGQLEKMVEKILPMLRTLRPDAVG